MKLMAVAGLALLCIAGQANAQVVVGVRSVAFGSPSLRFGFFRPPLFIPRGVVTTNFFAVTRFNPTPVFVTPVVVNPTPNITVNNFYGGGTPLLGLGYDGDTRGINLDRVQVAKPAAVEPPPPIPKPAEVPAAKPLPGVEVSKARPPVRPGKEEPVAKAEPKPLPKKPVPVDSPASMVDAGLAAFREGEYGLAAQRFRQATKSDPKLTRAWFFLAQAEFANANYRDAVTAIHAGMKLDKAWPKSPHNPRLDLYQGREAEFAEHLKRLTDSVVANPDHPTLLFLVAHQLWFDNQRKDAVTLFHRVRPLSSDRMYVDAFLSAGAGT